VNTVLNFQLVEKVGNMLTAEQLLAYQKGFYAMKSVVFSYILKGSEDDVKHSELLVGFFRRNDRIGAPSPNDRNRSNC
jgi:hypothetical protein